MFSRITKKLHRLRIPNEAGRVFRLEVGQRSELKPATIPI
jgi:hypothetical protein